MLQQANVRHLDILKLFCYQFDNVVENAQYQYKIIHTFRSIQTLHTLSISITRSMFPSSSIAERLTDLIITLPVKTIWKLRATEWYLF